MRISRRLPSLRLSRDLIWEGGRKRGGRKRRELGSRQPGRRSTASSRAEGSRAGPGRPPPSPATCSPLPPARAGLGKPPWQREGPAEAAPGAPAPSFCRLLEQRGRGGSRSPLPRSPRSAPGTSRGPRAAPFQRLPAGRSWFPPALEESDLAFFIPPLSPPPLENNPKGTHSRIPVGCGRAVRFLGIAFLFRDPFAALPNVSRGGGRAGRITQGETGK